MQITAPQLIALGLAVLACGWDLRTRRIPQVLTLGGALAGLAFHVAIDGWSGATTSATGWGMGIVIFLAPFALGGLGAGDVKLLGALGAWLGPRDVIWLALYAGIAGGVLALLVSLATGYLSKAVANLRLLITYWIVNGIQPLPDLTLEHGRSPRLAYAVPILAGTVVRLWLR